jgi:hypothetical protein
MHDHCPVCDLKFEREPGYFLGAMYFSYGLAIATGLPTLILLYLLGFSDDWIVVTLGCQLVLTSLWLFQYARVMWLHLDQWVDPR